MERTLAHVALFAALISVLGFLPRIDLVAGVPITFQSFGVMLAGAVLGARKGALAVLVFIGLIALGLPLLSGGANLWSVLYTPRIGYVIGFPVAAYVTGWLTQRLTALPLSLAAGVAAVGGGMIVLYAIGIPVAAIKAIWREEPLAMAEIMEAYAVQAIAVVERAGLDAAIVNPAGGGLARGHPVGASGAILAVRLFHGLRRGRGLAAIAAAGGIGTALLVEASGA